MNKITCPFCFEEFSGGEVKFRCINPHCRKENDEVYSRLRNMRIPPPLSHVFEKKNTSWNASRMKNNLSATCDLCQKESTKRICPHCHFELSHDAGMIDDHIIAIIGGRETGKGHYIATLVHRLENEVGQEFNFSLRMLGDDTRERFERDYRTPLFAKKTLIAGTVSATVDSTVKMPMVFRLTFQEGNRTRAINLSFFDSAGEDMQNLDIMSSEARYIGYASGIVFLLDPLQIDSVREKLPIEALPPKLPLAEPTYIVERLRELFERQHQVSATVKVSTPVAFVLSKVDALFPILDPSSELRHTGEHFGSFNLADAQSVHAEIWSYLQAWKGGLPGRVDSGFRNYQYFGTSSLGRPPDKKGNIETVSPIRVEDPFLWILYKLNLVKGRKGR
jgi:hypothetical protein